MTVVGGELVSDPDTSADRFLGLTVFETIAFEGDELIRGEPHLERLAASARTVGLAPLGGWEAVDAAIAKALEATGHASGIVRVSLHATSRPVGLMVPDGRAEVQVHVTAPRYGDTSAGVEAVTSTIQAPDEGSWPAHVKAPCLPRYLAHREARGRGAFEALMLDAEENVVSGTRSNVFAVLEDALVTPPSPPAFPGIVRSRVLDTARARGEPVAARRLGLDALRDARELFLTFTGPGVVPVVELDGRPVGDGEPGPRARELSEHLEGRSGST